MPTLKTLHYDVIIVGAGINGCTSAYFLSQAGLKVALVDKTGIASGGSGAAGAFISPKFSKEGPLKELMAVAYDEAMTFYTTVLASHTLLKPLLHMSQDNPDESISLEQSAVVDARSACETLASGIDFYVLEVQSPSYVEEEWHCEDLRSSHLVLTIGAYPKIMPIDYVGLRGIWGHRIDITTSSDVPCIMHQYVSISPTLNEGVIAIGATHDVHYSPFDPFAIYDIEAGRAELIEKALKTLKLNNIKILKDYTGLRSGSNDYMPMLGSLVDAHATLALHPHLQHGKETDPKEFVYYPNLTMINGSGGYGFVLAPYLAKRLKEYLVEGIPMDKMISPSRFFSRWAKRKKS
ncbi:MAG: FAD-dependent oxidoreductase [Sulfuricurvum sp.]|nr:FAD-dependent oxidoreductase [Sulfuricurvum sp.]